MLAMPCDMSDPDGFALEVPSGGSTACGSYISTVVPSPSLLRICTAPPDCPAKPCTIGNPRPEPLPTSFVVKNGSHACARVGSSIVQRDAQRASDRHGVPRVDRQVQDRELDLIGIDKCWCEAGVRRDLEADRRPYRPLQQVFNAGNQSPEIDRLRIEVLFTGKGEQLLDQRDAPFGGPQGALEQRHYIRIIARPAARQYHVSNHHRQQVVEIMGNAASQLAKYLELLRLAQGRLGRPVFGHFRPQAKIDLVEFET